jgi:hypothetical protein
MKFYFNENRQIASFSFSSNLLDTDNIIVLKNHILIYLNIDKPHHEQLQKLYSYIDNELDMPFFDEYKERHLGLFIPYIIYNDDVMMDYTNTICHPFKLLWDDDGLMWLEGLIEENQRLQIRVDLEPTEKIHLSSFLVSFRTV